MPRGPDPRLRHTDKHGYRHYKSDPAICRACPLLASCTASRNTQKIVTRHVWQDAKDRVDANRLTAWGKRIYKRRKETVERSFADAMQLHGHRYARMRGLLRVAEQCLLAAAAQNIKKIALILTRIAACLIAWATAIGLCAVSAAIKPPSHAPAA